MCYSRMGVEAESFRNTVPTAGTSQAALGSGNPLCEGFLLTKFQIQKRATLTDSPFSKWEPGNVLLSHGETPNYHRR